MAPSTTNSNCTLRKLSNVNRNRLLQGTRFSGCLILLFVHTVSKNVIGSCRPF